MLNLSIMALDTDHLDEICEDIIWQQKNGVSTHAMMMMTFNPEGTPPINKAEAQCAKYDLFRERLDAAGAAHGVLVQATMGHITKPYTPHPFQTVISLVTGEPLESTCCPLDKEFQNYMKNQMKTLAEHKPPIVMVDDDIGVVYRSGVKGCACKYHMALFNKLAGTNMSREELYEHIKGNSEEDKFYTEMYIKAQKMGSIEFATAMREGLDSVDPTIQGVVSGICTATYYEFSDEFARAFAGKGNPAIIRFNGGPYAKETTKYFSTNMFRAAYLKENTKGKVDMYLAESDACPHNRYSTSASLLHAHLTGLILEGADGAKHWITRLNSYEPDAGKAYRKKFAQNSKFYEKLSELVPKIKPFGCKIPISLHQDYQLVADKPSFLNLSAWSSCILERFGLPLYFSNEGNGAIFIDDFAADQFDDADIKRFLGGTLVLSSGAAEKLGKRGFSEYIGVNVCEWQGKTMTYERIDNKNVYVQYQPKQLEALSDKTKALSYTVHLNKKDDVYENLFPAVTSFENSLGGKVIVFCGNPDMPYLYFTAFSMLNGIRKKQFIDILSKGGHLPVYYTEDAEVYLRAGYIDDEMFVGFFNLGLDMLEDIPLYCENDVSEVYMLSPDGEKVKLDFTKEGNVIRIDKTVLTLEPVMLFIK